MLIFCLSLNYLGNDDKKARVILVPIELFHHLNTTVFSSNPIEPNLSSIGSRVWENDGENTDIILNIENIDTALNLSEQDKENDTTKLKSVAQNEKGENQNETTAQVKQTSYK